MKDKAAKVINVGDTDKNADWIASPERRKREIAIHARLAEKIEQGLNKFFRTKRGTL